jgi:predicted phage terminase large subunit-like protein
LAQRHAALNRLSAAERRQISRGLAGVVTARTLATWAREYVPAYFPLPPSAFHVWLTTALDALHTRRAVKQNIVAPRGSAKSTLVSFAYPLWAAVNGYEPYILLLSDTNDQAHKYLESIKLELENNADLARDYPAACGQGPVWRQERLRLRNGVVLEALGTGAKVRGRKNRHERPSLVIGDDLQNNEHILSQLERGRTWEWLTREVLAAGTPETNYLTLGTALHPECIVMRLLNVPGWSSQVFRAIIDWPERMDLWAHWEALLRDPAELDQERRAASAAAFLAAHREDMHRGGSVLWPEREPLEALMALRAMIGPTAFASEKQSCPVAPGTREWPDSYFPGSIWFTDFPENAVLTAMALDPSKGRGEGSDYSAYVYGAADSKGHIWLDADIQRRPTPQIVEDGILLFTRWRRPQAFAVEANAYQELLAVELARVSKERGMRLPLYLINNFAHKEVRVRTLGPYLARGELHFRRTPGGEMLVEQLKAFPDGEFVDGPDCLEQVIRTMLHLAGQRSDLGTPQILVS